MTRAELLAIAALRDAASRLLVALDAMHQRGETLTARASIAAADLAAAVARAAQEDGR